MITLKNGHTVSFNKDFDVFFQDLLESIIRESRRSSPGGDDADSAESNERFLKELMDNCIYVTHQLFDIAKEREDFSRFMVTGFIFNSIICSLPAVGRGPAAGSGPGNGEKIH